MSSETQGNSGKPTNAGSGYTPAPVKKTRTVTGSQIPQLQDQPSHQQAQSQNMLVQQNTNYNEQSRPSIQLNLNTIDQAAQTVLEKEAEAQNKLASFAPLSSTPLEYQSTQSDPQAYPAQFGANQDAWESSIPDSLTPSPYYQSVNAELPDLYKSRRRSLMFLSLLFFMSIWFIAMAIQVGVARLIEDPYGETMKAITGEEKNNDALDQLRAPVVQNTIVIEEGRALAKILSVQVLDKKHVAIQGVLLNESTSSIESALLKLTLRQSMGAKKPWAQQHEFACCEKLSLNQMSIEEIEERAQKNKMQLLQAENDLELNDGASRPFTFIAKIEDKKVKLKATDPPQAEVEVTFFE